MANDARIRFPEARLDFENEVGITGQDHDSYPAPGQQARYDWLRIYLIGLLAHQAAEDQPTQFRDGSVWFDLANQVFNGAFNGQFSKLANYIAVRGVDEDGGQLTLADWFASVGQFLSTFHPEVTFSGNCIVDGTKSIPIPESLRAALGTSTRCFLYKNGLLIDPRDCTIQVAGSTPTSIKLGVTELDNGDTFTVVLKNMTDAYFYDTTVTIP